MKRAVRTLRVFLYRFVTLIVSAMALLAQAYGLGQTVTLTAPARCAVRPAAVVLMAPMAASNLYVPANHRPPQRKIGS